MYKVGIIGLGNVGSLYDDDPLVKGVYTHAGAYKAHPETEIIASADIDKKKLEAFKKKFNNCVLYTDYMEMLKKEQLDILSICTGGGIHYDIIKNAVKYNLKAIWCEKPMTDTIEKADEIISLCKERNIILIVNYLRRWDTGIQSVKKYIDEGKIGDIQKVTVNYSKGIENSGSHIVDLLYYFFGEIDYVKACYSFNQEELSNPTLDLYIKFKSELIGVMVGLNSDFFFIFEMDIIGTKGRNCIKNTGYEYECYEAKDSEMFSGYIDLVKTDARFVPGLDDAMPNAVSDIISCIKSGVKPLCSGEDARKVIAVINAAKESVTNDGKAVSVTY